MSVINLGEVVYRLAKANRAAEADSFRRALRRHAFPFQTVPATNGRVWQAVAVKARHTVSYADAFAVALAREKDAYIATADPEILAVAPYG